MREIYKKACVAKDKTNPVGRCDVVIGNQERPRKCRRK